MSQPPAKNSFLRKVRKVIESMFLWFGGFVFIGVQITILIVIVLWPGEVELLGPLFCSDAQPEVFVVTDTYSAGGETSTDYTVYCMGARGDATKIGFLKPFLVLSAIHGFVITVPLFVCRQIVNFARRRKVDPHRPPSDALLELGMPATPFDRVRG